MNSESGEDGALVDVPDEVLWAEVRRRELASGLPDYYEQHRPLTMREAVEKANAIIATQPNLRDEHKWADAFYDIATLLGRIQSGGSGTP